MIEKIIVGLIIIFIAELLFHGIKKESLFVKIFKISFLGITTFNITDYLKNKRFGSLELIESFPKDNEMISRQDVKKIYLIFNKPIDQRSERYIGNYHNRTNSFRQWNIGGWIQYNKDKTRLFWHIHEKQLQDSRNYGPANVDYHTFEIHVGRSPKGWRLSAEDGTKLPFTIIRVRIKD
jgi:hypothetical protein